MVVRWRQPSQDWKKLNTNGSLIDNLGRAGLGAIIKDHNGNQAKGCCQHILKARNIEAKLWTLGDGLKLVTRAFHILKLKLVLL